MPALCSKTVPKNLTRTRVQRPSRAGISGDADAVAFVAGGLVGDRDLALLGVTWGQVANDDVRPGAGCSDHEVVAVKVDQEDGTRKVDSVLLKYYSWVSPVTSSDVL